MAKERKTREKEEGREQKPEKGRAAKKEKEENGGPNKDNNSDIAVTAGSNRGDGWMEPRNFNSYFNALV